MSKELVRIEVGKPGCVVCHGVQHARHEVVCGDVGEVALVQGLEPEQVCCGPLCGRGSLSLPREGGGIVVEVSYGRFPDWAHRGDGVVLRNGGCEL